MHGQRLRFATAMIVILVASQKTARAADEVILIPPDKLAWHVPDPEAARATIQAALDTARQAGDDAEVGYQTRLLESIDSIRKSEQIHLSLEEAIQRTLANNYVVETLRYNPAIETTRVVEAEAAFDGVFFGNLTRRQIDQPTASQLSATKSEFLTTALGVRKLLPSGTVITGQYQLNRTKQDFAYQTINPAYTSAFSLDLRQPLLRGFGLDFNRSGILISKNNRHISDLTFRRQIRDTIRQIEEAYWRLVQARADVVITARELADFEQIYRYLVARKDFDILPVNIAATEADLELAHVDFVRRRAALFDAQDRLVGAMNDPELNLADAIEVIPSDFPQLERLLVDRLAEVQTALDHRTEIHEQQLQVNNAEIGIDRAKNSELPKLDLALTATYQGLSSTADRSFDEVSRRKFINYEVGVQVELPIGNRGPKAARRRAELQRSQAAANLRRVMEDVILDVNLSVRRLETSYDQIEPSFASVEARRRELESHVARAERKDIGTLSTELGARRSLASTRRTMLNAIVEYNIAIVDLERAKGTLLEYNNIAIPTEDD